MMGLGRPPQPANAVGVDPREKPMITETDDLRATRLAFILGRRSQGPAGKAGVASQLVNADGDPVEGFNQDHGALTGNGIYDYGFNMAINSGYAPGVPGTERFQKLCSLEYLQRYFTNVLCNKAINLSTPFDVANSPWTGADGTLAWQSGLPRQAKAAADARTVAINAANAGGFDPDLTVGPPIRAVLVNAATKPTDMPDLGKLMGLVGSPAADADRLRQGIFARDFGPFLRGKGNAPGVLGGTKGEAPQALPVAAGAPATKAVDPFHVSRCAGDELAFALLERVIEQNGLSDWRPDGIVLSLEANDPSDKLSDEALAARDGQLFNVRIQGPAVGSTWTGDPSLETLPLDKVFVVIVADVWWGDLAANAPLKAFVDKVAPADGNMSAATAPTLAELRAYLQARETIFTRDLITRADMTPAATNFAAKQLGAFAGGAGAETTRMCNFRVMRATSSQMINYSNIRFDGAAATAQQVVGDSNPPGDEFMKVPNQSRMGLRLANTGGEYIIGGWCIGNVLDTSASRAAFPGAGTNIGVRTAPNSAALNVNVQIDWWDADRMWRSFMNPDNILTQRYVQTKPNGMLSPINKSPNDFVKGDAGAYVDNSQTPPVNRGGNGQPLAYVP